MAASVEKTHHQFAVFPSGCSTASVIFIFFPEMSRKTNMRKSRSNQADLAEDWWHSCEFLGSRPHGVDSSWDSRSGSHSGQRGSVSSSPPSSRSVWNIYSHPPPPPHWSSQTYIIHRAWFETRYITDYWEITWMCKFSVSLYYLIILLASDFLRTAEMDLNLGFGCWKSFPQSWTSYVNTAFAENIQEVMFSPLSFCLLFVHKQNYTKITG